MPNRPQLVNANELKGTYAVSWINQFGSVFKRTGTQFWRSPIYIRGKFLECVGCALMVGLSFIAVNHSQEGASQPITAIFMMLFIALAMINQMHVFAFPSRELYEVREAASNTFHWSALLLAQTCWEIIWSGLCQFFCFICFYWPAGFTGRSQEAGYFFLMYVIMFTIYFCTYGLWVLYFSPNVPSASIINSLLFPFQLLFCGILQPYSFMPGFWTFMYKLSPFTYFVQSFVSPLVHGKTLVCKESEYNILTPPSGESCSSFLGDYIDREGGYLKYPDATDQCMYCPYTMQEEVMATYNVRWAYRWRNFGFSFAYIIFNVVAMLGCYYLVRVRVWNVKAILDVKNWFSGPRKERHEEPSKVFVPQPGDEKVLKN